MLGHAVGLVAGIGILYQHPKAVVLINRREVDGFYQRTVRKAKQVAAAIQRKIAAVNNKGMCIAIILFFAGRSGEHEEGSEYKEITHKRVMKKKNKAGKNRPGNLVLKMSLPGNFSRIHAQSTKRPLIMPHGREETFYSIMIPGQRDRLEDGRMQAGVK